MSSPLGEVTPYGSYLMIKFILYLLLFIFVILPIMSSIFIPLGIMGAMMLGFLNTIMHHLIIIGLVAVVLILVIKIKLK